MFENIISIFNRADENEIRRISCVKQMLKARLTRHDEDFEPESELPVYDLSSFNIKGGVGAAINFKQNVDYALSHRNEYHAALFEVWGPFLSGKTELIRALFKNEFPFEKDKFPDRYEGKNGLSYIRLQPHDNLSAESFFFEQAKIVIIEHSSFDEDLCKTLQPLIISRLKLKPLRPEVLIPPDLLSLEQSKLSDWERFLLTASEPSRRLLLDAMALRDKLECQRIQKKIFRQLDWDINN